MVRVLGELIDLCKADDPEHFNLGTTDESVLERSLYDYAAEHGLQTYFEDTYRKSIEETSLEDCLNAFKEGLNAVIRDGKFYGFKRAS